MSTDDDVSSHRVRSNRWPTPTPLHPSAALEQAVEDVYEALEDRN